MRKIIVAFVLLFVTVAIAQPQSNEITAEGFASAKVKPDLAVLKISVKKQNVSSQKAIKELNDATERLSAMLRKLGIPPTSVKIAGYDLQKNSFEDNFYTASNDLTISINIDNKLLDSFYRELQAESYDGVTVAFEAVLSETLEKSMRKILVQKAIQDAKDNAANIAGALNVKIVKVKSVNNFMREGFAAVSSMKNLDKHSAAAAAAYGPATSFTKYDVEEQELKETITVVFEISN